MFSKSLIAISTIIILTSLLLYNGIEPGQLLNIQSLVIVFGGMALSIRFGFPKEKITETFHAVKVAMSGTYLHSQPVELLSEIIRVARIYRINGASALSRNVSSIENRFLKLGANLVAEGYDRWSLLHAMEREDKLLSSERKTQIQILRTLTRLAPALGMAGTVISLMQVVHDLSNPDGLTSSLGLALSSTLYGILMANLIFIPLTSKLEALAQKESDERTVVAEALLDIHNEEHPIRIAEKLNCYELYLQVKNEKTSETNDMQGVMVS